MTKAQIFLFIRTEYVRKEKTKMRTDHMCDCRDINERQLCSK